MRVSSKESWKVGEDNTENFFSGSIGSKTCEEIEIEGAIEECKKTLDALQQERGYEHAGEPIPCSPSVHAVHSLIDSARIVSKYSLCSDAEREETVLFLLEKSSDVIRDIISEIKSRKVA